MKKKIYYVVEKELQMYGSSEEATGFKNISLYEVQTNELVNIGNINNVSNSDNSIEVIKEFLDESGENYELSEFNQL